MNRVLSGCAVRAMIQLENAEPHFHLCESCAHIWMHKQELDADHLCPKCKSGPLKSGWGSMRSALNARRELNPPTLISSPWAEQFAVSA
jgi:hypothetical protein